VIEMPNVSTQYRSSGLRAPESTILFMGSCSVMLRAQGDVCTKWVEWQYYYLAFL